ncbi:MAG: metal ABC transporter ATP-binding protein [Arachnia sp.]
MSAPEPLLSAEGLYVSLGGLPILRDVSFQIDPGSTVAILGGNGAGKTTLLRSVLGLIAHQEGAVRVFGQSLASFQDWARVGYVPQHTSLQVANATVREIVATGRLARRGPLRWSTKQDRSAIGDALEQVGLADRSGWPFSALSGGQRQRTVIARALATKPELLIMDEPLAGVDLHSQSGIATLLGELRAAGRGMAIVLHELGPLAPLLDRSITLCDGRVVPADDSEAAHCDPPASTANPIGLADVIAGDK